MSNVCFFLLLFSVIIFILYMNVIFVCLCAYFILTINFIEFDQLYFEADRTVKYICVLKVCSCQSSMDEHFV